MLKLIKKIIAFLMALFVPATAAGSITPDVDRAAASATVYEYGLLYYTVDENDEITITSVKNTGESLGNVTIQAEIDGKPVKYFKCSGVRERYDIVSLTFPYNCELLDLDSYYQECDTYRLPLIKCEKYSKAHKDSYSKKLDFELINDDGLEDQVYLNWSISDGKAYVTGIRYMWYNEMDSYYPAPENISIPSELEGCPVVSVSGFKGEDYANINEGLYNVKTVTLPSSVKRIEDMAFAGLASLESIDMGDGVEEIGQEAFCSCINLKNVEIGSSVKYIGNAAFEGCENLESFTFKEGSKLERVGYSVTSKGKMTNIALPSSLKILDSYSLYNLNFNELVIPENVLSIGICAIGDVENLTVLSRDALLSRGVYAYEDDWLSSPSYTTLYCYKNSTAHDYAVEKNMDYVLIDESTLAPSAGSSASIGANGLVRGVTLGVTAAELESLLSVDGSATIQITDNSGNIGTGTRIDLINSTYGNVESSYYLVFSGDVDGDGVVDESDFLNARGVLAGNTEFENPAQFAAADLNGDGYFSICDYTLLKSVFAGSNILNSATGELTPAL